MHLSTDELIKAYNDYPSLRRLLSNKWQKEYVYSHTQFLDSSAPIKQRIWHLIKNISESVLCKCGNKLKWNTKNNTYRLFCSSKCAHTEQSVRLKIENTCLKKYGAKTNLITESAKSYYKELMIERFGVDNPFKSKSIQEEIKSKFTEKYGVDNPSKSQLIKDKITETHEIKYGRKRYSQIHYSQEAYDIRCDKQKLQELYDGARSVADIAKLLDIGHSQLCIHLSNLGIEIHRNIGQKQVYDYIKSIYDKEIILNDRKILDGKEIDIYIPELNVGFEYDGIFWHSENSANKKLYHAEKDRIAKNKGIKLYHITDIEWKKKQDIVKSRISSIVGKNKVIYGRDTEVRTIDRKIAGNFFNRSHIQGNASASFYAGLYHQEVLVAAISLAKSRYNTAEYELIRFCNQLNTNVIGGASKLFKYAINQLNASNVISFSDIRWGTGGVYEKLGFTHIRDNGPSYHYTHNYQTLENRIAYQKHKLSRILPIFDSTLSEWENMKNNGYDRYWDSGQGVFLWTNPNSCRSQSTGTGSALKASRKNSRSSFNSK